MLMEKFKEKNMSVCRACMEALTNLQSYCFTLLEVQDDVLEALKHQNPKVKQCTLEWMKICLDKANKQMASKLLPVYIVAIASCSDDATPLTRERALQVLMAFCLKATSASAIDKITAKLDDTRKKKLDEMLKEARGAKQKPNPQPAAQPAASSSTAPAPPVATQSSPPKPPDAAVEMDIDKPLSKKPKNAESKASGSKAAAPSRVTPKKSSTNCNALQMCHVSVRSCRYRGGG